MKLYKNDTLLVNNVEEASAFFPRLKGLLGAREVPEDYAMYFPRCGSVHTFFMRCAIDIIMLDNDGKVVESRENVRPFSAVAGRGAESTIEMKAGSISSLNIKTGDSLKLL